MSTESPGSGGSEARPISDPFAEIALTLTQREQMVETLCQHIGFYIGVEAEGDLARWIEEQIEERLTDLAAALDRVAEYDEYVRERMAQAWGEGIQDGARWTPTQWGSHKPSNPYRAISPGGSDA